MLRIAARGCGRIGRRRAESIAADPPARLASFYDGVHSDSTEGVEHLDVPALGIKDEVLASPEAGFKDGRPALMLAEPTERSVAERRTVHANEIG